MKNIPYGSHYITEEDIKAVVDVLKSDNLTQGPKIKEFEDAFADYVGSKFAVAVSNGTAGLHLAATVLNVKPGDKVIVTPMTFAASANCVRYSGGEVVFCDIDPVTYLMDINKLRDILHASPVGYYKGIIPVDFAGYPHNMEVFRKLADEFGLWIIEDACHAPGGYFVDSNGNAQYCGNGTFSDIAVFSFHPVKHIATGEGGMVTTNNKELYDLLCQYRTHGITKEVNIFQNSIETTLGNQPETQNPKPESYPGWYYEMQVLGYNFRITDIQAALGISQLKRAKVGIERRQLIARRYTEVFSKCKGIKPPFVYKDVFHAYHLYVIQVENRQGLYNFLRENKIFPQVHYVPLHLMPYYQALGNKKGDLPIVEDYYKNCLSLPMFPDLSDKEQNYVIEKVLEFVK